SPAIVDFPAPERPVNHATKPGPPTCRIVGNRSFQRATRDRRMRLIGAGLPRTATLSQKIALEMLGVGPCYHMVDVLSDLDRAASWPEAVRGNANWDEIFAGYQSTVDWPGSYFYRELHETYPDAKVLLSVRPGDAWARSMSQTITSILYGPSLMYDLSSA